MSGQKFTTMGTPEVVKQVNLEEYPRVVSEEVSNIEKRIIDFCLNKDNKIGKNETAQITAGVKKIVQRANELAIHLSSIYGKYMEAKEGRDELNASLEAKTSTILEIVSNAENKPVSNSNSYAQIVKSQVLEKSLRTDNSVVVYPKDRASSKSPNDITKDIKTALNPVAEGIRITTVRNLGEKGVLIRAAEKKDLNAILECAQLRNIGLTISRPVKRMPRLALYGVPSGMSEEEIRESLIRLNNLDEREIKEQLKFAFKFGRKDRITENIAIEVTPELRKKLLSLSRVYLGWSSCKVEDFIRITRCYKCNGYNHIQKNCKALTPSCAHCAGPHETNTCDKKEQPPKCTNCIHFKLAHNHSANDKDCPSYANALKGLINRTDYGV